MPQGGDSPWPSMCGSRRPALPPTGLAEGGPWGGGRARDHMTPGQGSQLLGCQRGPWLTAEPLFRPAQGWRGLPLVGLARKRFCPAGLDGGPAGSQVPCALPRGSSPVPTGRQVQHGNSKRLPVTWVLRTLAPGWTRSGWNPPGRDGPFQGGQQPLREAVEDPWGEVGGWTGPWSHRWMAGPWHHPSPRPLVGRGRMCDPGEESAHLFQFSCLRGRSFPSSMEGLDLPRRGLLK